MATDCPFHRRSWLHRHYGAGPWHLLGMLLCFALAGYVASLLVQVPQAGRVAVWFVGAGVVHDLVIWPAYTVADRLASRLQARAVRRPRVPWVNHVRVPTVLAGCLLAVSFPLVLGWTGPTYRRATGLSPSPYTVRWLVATGVLFGASAFVYAIRVTFAWRAGRR